VPLVAERDAEYGWAWIPDGKAAVATIGEGGELITIWINLLPVKPLLSVTVKFGVNVPSTDGVPVSAPAAERAIPAGSPVALQA
jgi:hypothetical protein